MKCAERPALSGLDTTTSSDSQMARRCSRTTEDRGTSSNYPSSVVSNPCRRSAMTRWTAGRYALVLGGWALTTAVVSTQQQQQPPPPRPGLPPGVFGVVGPGARARRIADVVMTVPLDNPMSDAKTALGRRLFFDKQLSNDRTVSCGTCHEPDRAFADQRTLAVGVFERVGRRHSPALINRGYGRSQFWDGRSASLEDQVLKPIADRNEMDLKVEDAVARIAADRSYQAEFQAIFAAPPTADTVSKALAAFVRSVTSNDSPYDRFIDGQTDALTADQQAGLKIFRTRALCTVCHAEPFFTDEAFRNTGVAYRVDATTGAGAYQDDGRFEISRVERDRGAFKVPTLREIARTAPYMHDGSLATLMDVVNFYNGGGRPNPNLFIVVRPLGLSEFEKQQLVKFLEALSGTVSKLP